ncbi:uncharacterized protein LOC126770313 [Nymphalis io]|uniref:uncharacterized protein LOC126770313 n=1 Tax=Inachis io TaxID=171585 RepID=UPI00216A56B0|nr:uncharacterized protein LOC126770313 [Nymphalis io]
MDKESADVRKRNSCFVNISPKISDSREECKSHINIISKKKSPSFSENQYLNTESREYYKKYIFDDKPVKDDSDCNDHSFSKNDAGQGDKNDFITKFDLDEIEILKKMSRELQTDENSSIGLDSNIKLFKTTVNQILENFYINMQEFELYKKKYHEILHKNRGNTVTEMEDLIKDMIQHIRSSDSSVNNSKFTDIKEFNEEFATNNRKVNIDNTKYISNSFNSTIEAFKNENYLTDSTFEQNSSKFNTSDKKEKFLNIFLQSGTRYVEIKMDDRSLFSEINIREHNFDVIKEPLASTENFKKLKEKNIELENYVKEQELYLKDREIPVKSSNAKKNIHLNEDFLDNDKNDCINKFFIFRICNYLCRKLRKNAFV